MVTRRKMLGLIGGGVVLAAAAGAGGFVATRGLTTALQPWDQAGGYRDPRLAALSWAILAPNPHNRQPWQAELIGETEMLIWRDAELNLPETDPFDRQMTIGMGCFLEILRQAAAEQGYKAQFDLFPQGEDGPVCHVRLSPGGVADPLFAQVLARHTNRNAYDDRLPEVGALRSYASDIVADPTAVAALRDLTTQAMEIEMATPRTHMESVRLMRFGKREVEANPDGIAVRGALLEALMAAGMLTRAGQGDPASTEYQQTLDMLRATMMATPAYAVVKTDGNSRADQIEAGRQWVRLHLAATAQGLAMQPVSQALQEYPEQAELFAKVHATLAEPGETVQMLARLGYAAEVGPSPRWPLESRVTDGSKTAALI